MKTGMSQQQAEAEVEKAGAEYDRLYDQFFPKEVANGQT